MEKRNSFISKSGLIVAISSLILCAFTSSTVSDQQNVVITLYVDTGEIDSKNTATTCNFGQTDGSSNEDYIIHVNVGDNITWEGVSSTSPSADVVDITKIKHKKGKDIFGKDLDPASNGPKKSITGKALFRTAGDGDYKYDISFVVTNNGVRRNGTFHIDPKIQVH